MQGTQLARFPHVKQHDSHVVADIGGLGPLKNKKKTNKQANKRTGDNGGECCFSEELKVTIDFLCLFSYV